MSGSGSALFSLFVRREEANAWAGDMEDICKSTCGIRIVQPHKPIGASESGIRQKSMHDRR
jgi:4-diphosphocytidyl-2C-methyl-D-erythritol kinase